MRRAKEKVQDEEKNSRAIHEELAQIRKTKAKVKECLTLLKNKQTLPVKREPGKKIVVMNSDIELLQAEISDLEGLRDRIISMSDHEKARFDQMLKDAKQENRALRKELDLRDRVGFDHEGTQRKPDKTEGVRQSSR